jgi:non-ribosomal peptide synthetase component E (peptide arylation enzyme)
MGARIEKREDGWFLEGKRLAGVELSAVAYYRKEGYWAGRTIGQVIEESAAKWPRRAAFVFGQVKVSYGELNRLSSMVALGFLDLGIKPGDMVAVQLPNTVEHVLAVLALGKMGGVCVTIGPVMREKEVTYILNHCKCKGIIIPSQYHKFDYCTMIRSISEKVPTLEFIIATANGGDVPDVIEFQTLLRRAAKYELSDLKSFVPDADDISLIGFTSGTTANPKAYIHTHNTELANVFNNAVFDGYLMAQERGVNMALPGFSWMYGRWSNMLSGIMSGVTNVIIDPLTPENILTAFERERPTNMHGAPPLYRSIVDGLASLQGKRGLNLRVAHYGGSVMPFEVARQFKGICHLVTSYGLSEISPVCATGILDPPTAQIYSAGRPAWGNKVMVVGAEGSKLDVGEEGEVVVQGPGLLLGYLNQPEANADAFSEKGVFRTGDVGFFDEYGYLHITGRNKDVIDRGGVKFSPREVEELLLVHPKVKDVAIVGMPDQRLGEKSCAFVIVQDNQILELDELVTMLKRKGLATYKLPERLEIVDSFPYTPTGKLQKYVLRERIAKILQDEHKVTLKQ